MDIVFAGTPDLAGEVLTAILAHDFFTVTGVLTQPNKKKGRGSGSGRSATPSPVARIAIDHGIEVYQPDALNTPEAQEIMQRWQPQCCAVVAYGKLIPESLLTIPTHGWVNLHYSLLPAWRGASPVQSAIAAGDTVTGVTTFQLEKGLDSGPIYGTITENIQPDDTTDSLLKRLTNSGSTLLVATLMALAQGHAHPIAQSNDDVSYAAKITTDSARIRWDLPAHIIDRHVRSVTSQPGAWTLWHDQRIKLAPLELTTQASTADPGTVEFSDGNVFINTGSTKLKMTHIQPAGKKFMSAHDWQRGIKNLEIVRFSG